MKNKNASWNFFFFCFPRVAGGWERPSVQIQQALLVEGHAPVFPQWQQPACRAVEGTKTAVRGPCSPKNRGLEMLLARQAGGDGGPEIYLDSILLLLRRPASTSRKLPWRQKFGRTRSATTDWLATRCALLPSPLPSTGNSNNTGSHLQLCPESATQKACPPCAVCRWPCPHPPPRRSPPPHQN